jgi:uncharacterized Fe-S cluster-containing radical SAM superfamily protein
MAINTEVISAHLRAASIDVTEQRLLITDFRGTEQEEDMSEPANCEGFGRIRHFRRYTSQGWPSNPLPIDPACKALGLPVTDMLPAQAFQNAACNWRCWYCYVPFNLLSANLKHTAWLSAAQLVDLYIQEPNRPLMIDLTGGQPDLTPEWIPWMMKELQKRELQHEVYLWSDDNLSNDFFWRFLSDRDREVIATYPKYGRVCCFKGFNSASFAFNTKAEAELFDEQFSLMGRLLTVGMDLYAYATFTTPKREYIAEDMRRFVDRLQMLDDNLPLRTIPLEISIFTPVEHRLDDEKRAAMSNQWLAIEAWQRELETRYSASQRAVNIADVGLQGTRPKMI